uniref:Reverse transcriptase Ty1/copia-type domain-containing protein n=1 Tax=Fagus sylvatica TaxID=28930 RepID=A0A2N9FSB8_FAGSY
MDCIDDTISCPVKFLRKEDGTEFVNPEFLHWKARDKALISLLSVTLSLSALSLVIGQTSAQGIWTVLEQRYTAGSRSNVVSLKMELNGIKKGSDPMNKYLQRIKESRDKLSTVGINLDDEEILHIVLKGLLAEFYSFSLSMLTKDDPVSFAELHALLSTEEELIKNLQDLGGWGNFTNRAGHNNGGYHNNFSSENFNPTVPSSVPPPFNNNSRLTCQICYKQGHTTLDCYQQMNYAYQGRQPPAKLATIASTANSSQPPASWLAQTTWILDSGTTDHFTPDVNNLPDCSSYTDSQQVFVGNGQQLPISNIRPHPTTAPITPPTNPSDSILGPHPTTIHSPHFDSILGPHPTTIHSPTAPILESSSLRPSIISSTPLEPVSIIEPIPPPLPNSSQPVAPLISDLPIVPTSPPPHPLADPSIPTNTHPMTTRAKSRISCKKIFTASSVNYFHTEPPTCTIASRILEWRAAMASEFEALQRQSTWSLVPASPHQNLIGCRWVFKLKRNSDGSIARYKARLVAKGFHQ